MWIRKQNQYTLLNKFYLKREVLCKKLNGVNYRRLIKQYFDIINGFKQTFVKMSNILVIDEEIYLLTNKYKWLLKEINEVYRCMRILNDDDNLIKKTRIHMQKTILL